MNRLDTLRLARDKAAWDLARIHCPECRNRKGMVEDCEACEQTGWMNALGVPDPCEETPSELIARVVGEPDTLGHPFYTLARYVVHEARARIEMLDPLDGQEKVCPTCEEPKPLSAFNRNRTRPDGRQARCRDCERERKGNDRYKLCPSCDEVKPRTRFAKNQAQRDGLQTYCRDCHNRGRRERYGEEAA